jgi:hypothetical protein
LQERFYFGDGVLPLFESGIPLLLERLKQLPDQDKVRTRGTGLICDGHCLWTLPSAFQAMAANDSNAGINHNFDISSHPDVLCLHMCSAFFLEASYKHASGYRHCCCLPPGDDCVP